MGQEVQSRGHLFVTFLNYTVDMNWQDVCLLVAMVHIVTQKLFFIRESGGFAKALLNVHVYVCVDADEFHR